MSDSISGVAASADVATIVRTESFGTSAMTASSDGPAPTRAMTSAASPSSLSRDRAMRPWMTSGGPITIAGGVTRAARPTDVAASTSDRPSAVAIDTAVSASGVSTRTAGRPEPTCSSTGVIKVETDDGSAGRTNSVCTDSAVDEDAVTYIVTTTLAPAFAPSANVSHIKESATLAVASRARTLKAAGREILDLGAGEPDFDTPEFIRRAAQKAIDSGATRYTATEGILPLRQAIAAQANAGVDPAEVVVSTGSKQSLFNACFTLFGPGDEVLIPTPSWTSYYEMVSLARATAVAVYGDISRGLRVTAAE